MSDSDIPAGLREVLRDIGLADPDLMVPLHARLVETLHRLGPNASFGSRIVAMRWDFNWELEDAGRVFAKAKVDYERFVARKKVELLSEPKMSVAKAETIAEAEDQAYQLKLAFLLAEQRERSMRKFLETLSAALDNHRTDRADQRAGDVEHARTGV
jgi:hypothetical protein